MENPINRAKQQARSTLLLIGGFMFLGGFLQQLFVPVVFLVGGLLAFRLLCKSLTHPPRR